MKCPRNRLRKLTFFGFPLQFEVEKAKAYEPPQWDISEEDEEEVEDDAVEDSDLESEVSESETEDSSAEDEVEEID